MPSAALACRVGRENGGSSGGVMPMGTDRTRRWVRIWSIADAWVMQATIRMAPWQVGHASGSISKSCWSRVAHRRDASVGASGGAGTIAGGPSARVGAAFWRVPRGGWHTSHNTAS